MSDINESQKKITIPPEEWEDRWDMAFKREKKNDSQMKRKPKNDRQDS